MVDPRRNQSLEQYRETRLICPFTSTAGHLDSGAFDSLFSKNPNPR